MSVEKLEFDFKPNIGAGLRAFFHSQLFVTPPYPSNPFKGQTIIVTGSNVGLGLEAARHFYRLNCARLILAVRSASKGQIAKEDIVESVKLRTDADAVEIWPLDLSSTQSTLAFVERARSELPRLDVLVAGAGINSQIWEVCEGFERSIQVNVLNTFLLSLSLLPRLTETKKSYLDSSPHLVVVSSEAHRLTKFKEINAPDLYAKLNDKESFIGQERYQIGKLLEVLIVRELVTRLKTTKSSTPPVIINLVNPGLCTSTLGRGSSDGGLLLRIMRRILDRSTEVGGRSYVTAAGAGLESHGEFLSDGKTQDVEWWIYTEAGQRAQRKVFEQTMKILEERRPGITREVGL
ncbi:NAD(P)-binding protein [Hypoxylon sp. NC1633]|nr:NAD(P)-binding protein [Hypoxylon sp. NC1633]